MLALFELALPLLFTFRQFVEDVASGERVQ